jgi:GGDEF domain-containing protein
MAEDFVTLVETEVPLPVVDSFRATVSKAPNPYQAAFEFLLSVGGEDRANDVVQRGVLAAYRRRGEGLSDLRAVERDLHGWSLPRGMESLGIILRADPARFGEHVLTTNFDPLIEVSVQKAGGRVFRSCLDHDGSLLVAHGEGCHVVHLHGDWLRTDTLHTGRQLGQRTRLEMSLRALLRRRTLVVVGYGGWDDVLLRALASVQSEGREDATDVLWASHHPTEAEFLTMNAHVAHGFHEAQLRYRFQIYYGVDANHFLPELESRLTPNSLRNAEFADTAPPASVSLVSRPDRLPSALPLNAPMPTVPMEVVDRGTDDDDDEAWLLVQGSPDTSMIGRYVKITKGRISIGRGVGNDLAFESNSVSKKHALIEQRLSTWILRDEGSTNGTYFNGQRVLGSVALRDNDRIGVGEISLRFEFARSHAESEPILAEIHRRRTLDSVPGVLAREAAYEVLRTLASLNQPAALVFFHVSGLHAVSREYGDNLLAQTFDALRGSLPMHHCLIRHQGPIFAYVLSNAGYAEAVAVAEMVSTHFGLRASEGIGTRCGVVEFRDDVSFDQLAQLAFAPAASTAS